MMLRSSFLVAGLLTACTSQQANAPALHAPGAAALPGLTAPAPLAGLVVTLNGAPLEPEVLSLWGEPERPRSGDVLLLDKYALVLDQTERYAFFLEEGDGDRLFLQRGDGRRELVGAAISATYDLEAEREVVNDALAPLSAAELARLRAVHLDGWTPGTATRLAQLQLEQACITLTDKTAHGPRAELPPLPQGVRYLLIRENSSVGIKVISGLRRFSELRLLALELLAARTLHLALIQRSRMLRYLDLSGHELSSLAALAQLGELRQLILDHCNNLASIAFARQLPQLRRLSLKHTPLEDLRPLSGLRQLERVDADGAEISRLPRGPLPALRRLSVVPGRLSKTAVRAFAGAHPRCELRHGWKASLLQAAGDATRLRVRTGGTCHRDLGSEETLFEIRDRAEVAALLARLELDETHLGHHCMCCGAPSIELYRGEALLATLGVHHGVGLRWPGGWPADARLTAPGVDFLMRWMADHGYDGLQRERREQQRQEAARQRRLACYGKLLPEAVGRGLSQATSAEEAGDLFEQEIPDEVDRLALFLLLFGCEESDWGEHDAMDRLLQEQLLRNAPPAALAQALRRVAGQPQGANGGARWLFGEAQERSVARADLSAVLRPLALAGLSHPQANNRRRTIDALGRIGGRQAVALLRRLLAGKIPPRPLPPEQQVGAGLTYTAYPETIPRPAGCSEQAYSALVLGHLGARGAAGLIRRLERAAPPGPDKATYAKALELLRAVRTGLRP